MYLDCCGKSRARDARPPEICPLFCVPRTSLARPVGPVCAEGTRGAMMGEHGLLSHSLLALDRGRAQPDGATRPAGSSTATEPCDLLAVEIEAQANPNPNPIPDPNPDPIPNRL